MTGLRNISKCNSQSTQIWNAKCLKCSDFFSSVIWIPCLRWRMWGERTRVRAGTRPGTTDWATAGPPGGGRRGWGEPGGWHRSGWEGREKFENLGREMPGKGWVKGGRGLVTGGREGREMSGKDWGISGRDWVRLCGEKSLKVLQGCRIGIQQPR